MPISRDRVRRICSSEEYDLYCASLRLKLPELNEPELRVYIERARGLVKPAPAGEGVAVRRAARKAGLLAGALSRFEGRLRALASGL